MMSTEEQEELLQKLLFEKDVPTKDQPEDDPEDFVSRSQ